MKSIKNIIYNLLVENNNFSLDLSDKKNVLKWLEENAPEQIFDEDGNIDWSYNDVMTGDDLETLIYSYMEKYNEISSESDVEIYRLLKLNSIKDLNLKSVGVFWSFEPEGVGAYGIHNKDNKKGVFILNATINTIDIDWEKGFYSFLAYGKFEFECYVKKGSQCLITHINDVELKVPINGVC